MIIGKKVPKKENITIENFPDKVDYKSLKELFNEGKEKKLVLTEDLVNEITRIKDPSFVKSKRRPKEAKRILGLYERFKKIEKENV